MKDLKIVFLGTPDFVKPIKNVLAKHFTLVESLNEADLGVVVAYGRILTKEELSTPKYGFINIHPSLLPKYRGASPIQSAILNGDKISGITIIKMDEKVDHGPIIYQEELDLSNNDTFDILSKKMFQRAADILPKIIKDFIAGKIIPYGQNHPMVLFCPKLTRDSGYFDFDNPPSPEKLDRMIRAYHPWPGVWTRWLGKIIKFLPSPRHPDPERAKLFESEPEGSFPQSRRRVEGEGSNFLIQMEGKKPISYKDFLNGYPNFPKNILI